MHTHLQSEIASERPGVFDCLWEGMTRTMAMTTQQTTRLLPMWQLMAPSALHGLLHYVIASLAQYSVVMSIRTEMMENKVRSICSSCSLNHHYTSIYSKMSEEVQCACLEVQSPYRYFNIFVLQQPSSDPEKSTERSIYETFYPELLATFTGNLLADTILFPLETIIHRLLLQGTRTIIDNTDSGLGVVPIITRYEGVMDCLKSIIAEEGLGGLYKGFGALVLQYGVHVAILKLAKFIFERMAAEATTPERTIPLSDLHKMQQMQAQVRGQAHSLSPQASPSKKGHSPHRVAFRGQSTLRGQEQQHWQGQSSSYGASSQEYGVTGTALPRF